MSDPTNAGPPLRDDITPEAVTALRLAADNLPVSRPGQPNGDAADWLRRRADAFDEALAQRRGRTPNRADVDHLARVLMAAWEDAEGKPVTPSYVATFVDMARAVLGDGLTRCTTGGLCLFKHTVKEDPGFVMPSPDDDE